jgi:hypothetical protein
MDLASGLELETFLVTTIYGTEDKNEGISAFLEKREASFQRSLAGRQQIGPKPFTRGRSQVRLRIASAKTESKGDQQ